MNRHIVECPIVPSRTSDDSGVIRETFKIELVTPLFGGGVEPGCNDPDTLIRPSSVRGHLRFWWRATRGARFAQTKDLREQEGRIWGTTKNPSQVTVEVVDTEVFKENQRRWATHRRVDGRVKSVPQPEDRSFPMYALFPFQGETEKTRHGYEVVKHPSVVTWKAGFVLRISWPKPILGKEAERLGQDISLDVKAAVWAWVNFGGLGARTRRGCGALYSQKCSPTEQTNIQDWYVSKLKEFDIPVHGSAKEWPTLPPKLLIMRRKSTGFEAWQRSVALMQTFRQGPNIGRNPGSGGKPGRSRWPEPESIREISNEQNKLSQRPSNQKQRHESIPVRYFPRGEFGMPIIFEIRNEDLKPTLQPDENISRMASPVILKPLALSQSMALSMIVCLKTKPLQSAVLQGKGLKTIHHVDEKQIRNSALAEYLNSPMARGSRQRSALQAFISFVKEKEHGFEEVGL